MHIRPLTNVSVVKADAGDVMNAIGLILNVIQNFFMTIGMVMSALKSPQ